MYIITGVSRGLGKSLAELLLENGEVVCGIGRTNSLTHPNYSFIECDLNDITNVKSIELNLPDEEVFLINNAGIIGEIARLSSHGINSLETVLNVNTIAPIELAIKFYNAISNKNKFRLVNISSGAAKRAIPSWGAYCASKSALNMLTETFYLEEKEKGFSPKVYAVSPGVIDTGMQEQIRSADKNEFSSLNNFIALKKENKLYSPVEAAKRLLKLISLPYQEEVFFDLREIDL